MSEIIYTSLIKFPIKITSASHAISYLMSIVPKPNILTQIKSNIIYIDSYHINIVRYFENLEQYQRWMFSAERNSSDITLIKNGFFLYTKQAHL